MSQLAAEATVEQTVTIGQAMPTDIDSIRPIHQGTALGESMAILACGAETISKAVD